MEKFWNKRRASVSTNLLVSLLIIFHLSILTGLIPYDIVWGGRLKNDAQMYSFESFSILMNAYFLMILLMKNGTVKRRLPLGLINGSLWMFLVLFAVNTIGNLLAETLFEKFFALLTILFTINIWILLKKDPSENKKT
ncbi:MAG TPA: hypothetical protein DEQ34_06785 [Balneolaceae bacterium]|nr:hypothetical protein [Balneolaceae bacterium]|tara:strand:+ start:19289 stop:19702 length:414 start_codon:yes stop_codon:yes gene_type:complete